MENENEVGEAPTPTPPKKNHMGWKIAGAVVLGLIVLGAISNAVNPEQPAASADVGRLPSYTDHATSSTEDAVVRSAWEKQSASDHADICAYVDLVGLDEAMTTVREGFENTDPDGWTPEYAAATRSLLESEC